MQRSRPTANSLLGGATTTAPWGGRATKISPHSSGEKNAQSPIRLIGSNSMVSDQVVGVCLVGSGHLYGRARSLVANSRYLPLPQLSVAGAHLLRPFLLPQRLVHHSFANCHLTGPRLRVLLRIRVLVGWWVVKRGLSTRHDHRAGGMR